MIASIIENLPDFQGHFGETKTFLTTLFFQVLPDSEWVTLQSTGNPVL